MNYQLVEENKELPRIRKRDSIRVLYRFLEGARFKMAISFGFLLINSITVIWAPFLIGDITGKYLPTGDKTNLLNSLIFLGAIYVVGAFFAYLQIRVMGQAGQMIVFNLRNAIFVKLQTLPLQFFNQNKAGDLISRINNDTDRMSQAFSETLLRFTGDVVVIAGIATVMMYLNAELGLIAIVTLVIMVMLTFGLSGWIKSRNDKSLQKLGEMSGQITESLNNFKVTVVFNRRDYFRESFAKVNTANQNAATWATVATGLLAPLYAYAGNIASAIILIAGIQILIIDKATVGLPIEFGLLLSFILYSNSFFGPLREMGELFAQMQVAIASWSRIYRLLKLESNLKQLPQEPHHLDTENYLMKFKQVDFAYDPENLILKDINLDLESGKTYALVGPTGGGKSTTASLMVRLFDVTEGQVFFKGKDIRTYSPDEVASQIGFILQEPFLFSGTIAENIRYGNDNLADLTDEQLEQKLKDMNLESLINRFGEGLSTEIKPGAENISLGQRQLINFVRILLREPELLILDEATANVDTVTEQLLEDILNKLPAKTTKVIIAHRLNTIERADKIFFISGGRIEKPVDFSSALDLINATKAQS